MFGQKKKEPYCRLDTLDGDGLLIIDVSELPEEIFTALHQFKLVSFHFDEDTLRIDVLNPTNPKEKSTVVLEDARFVMALYPTKEANLP